MALKQSSFFLIQVALFAAVAAQDDFQTCRYDGDCFSSDTPCCCSGLNWEDPTCTESNAACRELHGGDESFACGFRSCTNSTGCHPKDTCCFEKRGIKGLCKDTCTCDPDKQCYASEDCSGQTNSNLCCCASEPQNYCGNKIDDTCDCI